MHNTLRMALVAVLICTLTSGTSEGSTNEPEFGPCPDEVESEAGADEVSVECAEISVPLDYDWPEDDQLSLNLSRIPASGTAAEYRGSLLVNPGGPGNAGLDYAVSKRADMPESLRRSYDIVGFDPRGIGRSNPIDCGPLGGLFDSPSADPVPTNPAAEREHVARLRESAVDCREHAGAVLPHINTANTARDMDQVRQALGEPALDFLGVSYGSYLGAAYAGLFPEKTGKMVLDSVVGPDSWVDFDRQQGAAMIEQRDVLFDWIAARPALGLGATREAVRDNYLETRSSLDEQPANETFGADEFDRLVYDTLSRTERWGPFAQALSIYTHTGDATDLGPAMPETDRESRNREAALRAVKCADDPATGTGQVLDTVRSLRAKDPQPILTGFETDVCPQWPQDAEGPRLGHPEMSAPLLVQASHDPTTPLAGAQRMRDVLTGSRMVTLRNSYSHGVFASQDNTCVDSTVANYLLRGELPRRDTTCSGPGLPAS